MKYKVQERVPSIQIWEYEVEANSETEALEMVLNGDVEMQNYLIETPEEMDPEFIIDKMEDKL